MDCAFKIDKGGGPNMTSLLIIVIGLHCLVIMDINMRQMYVYLTSIHLFN